MVDLPAPDGPSRTRVRPGPARSRTSSRPSPDTELVRMTATPPAAASAFATASAASAATSALVSSTAGVAPLSHATASMRSIRFWPTGRSRALTTATTSTSAARTCRVVTRSSECLREMADHRGRTATIAGPSPAPSSRATQSPVAGVSPTPAWRDAGPNADARTVPASVTTRLEPRSTRATRPGMASGRSRAAKRAATRSPHP